MNAEKIYHTYFMQVYSFVMNIVKDPELAEEITQSTFFKAMTAKSDFKKEAAEYTWLCSIARNLCNDHFRKSKRISDASMTSKFSVITLMSRTILSQKNLLLRYISCCMNSRNHTKKYLNFGCLASCHLRRLQRSLD